MEVCAQPVIHGLFDQMPPVAGGVNRDVLGIAGHVAFEDAFEITEGVVILAKAEVIDIEDELQRVIT